MRIIRPLIIVAAFAAAPVAAQTTDPAANSANTAAEAEASAGVPEAGTMNVEDSAAATAPTNGLTAGPGAAPETTMGTPVDTSYGDAAREDRDGFPWGILGLLGLAGLIPRKRRDETSDRAR